MAKELKEIDLYREAYFRGEGLPILQLDVKHCYWAACVVPMSTIKRVEVETGLAIPVGIDIELLK